MPLVSPSEIQVIFLTFSRLVRKNVLSGEWRPLRQGGGSLCAGPDTQRGYFAAIGETGDSLCV